MTDSLQNGLKLNKEPRIYHRNIMKVNTHQPFSFGSQ